MKPHLSQSVVVGDMLLTSGQLAIRSDGTFSSKCSEQTVECLAKIEALLEEHGLSRYDVVKTTVWLKHAKDFAEYNTAYAGFFGEYKPARSSVVAELAFPDALIEIEAIAKLRT